jgi:hypothetical protein
MCTSMLDMSYIQSLQVHTMGLQETWTTLFLEGRIKFRKPHFAVCFLQNVKLYALYKTTSTLELFAPHPTHMSGCEYRLAEWLI